MKCVNKITTINLLKYVYLNTAFLHNIHSLFFLIWKVQLQKGKSVCGPVRRAGDGSNDAQLPILARRPEAVLGLKMSCGEWWLLPS